MIWRQRKRICPADAIVHVLYHRGLPLASVYYHRRRERWFWSAGTVPAAVEGDYQSLEEAKRECLRWVKEKCRA